MPRFVILRHELPGDHVRESHWDLMLEMGEVLWTWALPALMPELLRKCVPNLTIVEAPAQRLNDHRTTYLKYEGPVSDDRGTVSRWDEGIFALQRQSDDLLIADLNGREFKGQIKLTRVDAVANTWRLEFMPK